MSDFAPGVARMKAAGYKVGVAPYPDGAAGITLSLSTIAQKIREGRLDADVRGWAGDVLMSAGRPKSIRDRAQAILDAFRAQTMYLPDPVGAEAIVSAGGTMCLRPGLCVRARDCIPQGTLLLRDDYALVPIEEIKVGDRIWGYDKFTHVQNVWSKGVLPVDDIALSNGELLRLTGGHKVYLDPTTRVLVSELRAGDTLLRPEATPPREVLEGSRREKLIVEKIVRESHEAPCWDITTDDHYVYLPEHDVTVSNCDDGTVAVGAALLSVGIPVLVVKQNFGPGHQEHVLLKCQDEDEKWLGIEISHPTLPVGPAFAAVSEEIIDPMDQTSLSTGTAGAEIVTLGALPAMTGLAGPTKRHGMWTNGYWIEYRYGRWWAYINGHWIQGSKRVGLGLGQGEPEAPKFEHHAGRWWLVGAGSDVSLELTDEQAHEFGLGADPTTTPNATPVMTTPVPAALGPAPNLGVFQQSITDLTNQVGGPIMAGDTYLGENDFAGAVTAYQAAGTAGVTNVGPEIDRVGFFNATHPFVLQAAKVSESLQFFAAAGASAFIAQQAKMLAYQLNDLYTQAIAAGAIAQGAGGVAAQKTVPAGNIPTGLVVAGAVGLGLVGGFVAWHVMRGRAA